MNLLDFIFPKRCVGCGRLGRYFCISCQKNIEFILSFETICPVCERPAMAGATHPRCQTRVSLDGLTSFFHYRGSVRAAIKVLKYRSVSDIAREFVSFIPILPLEGIVVPIPLHISRLKERGFNQAEVVGKELASRLHMSLRTDILTRIKKTPPQVSMREKKARLGNMKGVFAVQRPDVVLGLDVVLFDDVFTTGATMRSAAAELKRAGAKQVWAVTIAR